MHVCQPLQNHSEKTPYKIQVDVSQVIDDSFCKVYVAAVNAGHVNLIYVIDIRLLSYRYWNAHYQLVATSYAV